jgi:DNA invertase Pin-like site-specific DNA recombinase
MLIGYARVSTHDQTLSLQAERPSLAQAMNHLRAGDTLVWRLDRLGRSLRHLIDTVNELEAKGIGFKSLQENIDALERRG